MLGEFEYLLLCAAARLGDDAYGVPIRKEIELATGRRCSTGALYTTLDRLESKGLIKTWIGGATPQRGGRAKRMVRVTAKGSRAAAAFYKAVTQASRGASLGKGPRRRQPMNRLCWWLVDKLSQTLDPDEQDAVHGDLAESGATSGRALCEILGLIASRQTALWRDWPPWLALVGIAIPFGWHLLHHSLSASRTYDLYSWILWNYEYIDPAILEENGMTARRGVGFFVLQSVTLIVWSWTSGCALASLSGRATWVTGTVFLGEVGLLMSALLLHIFSPKPTLVFGVSFVLVLFPFALGLRRGLRPNPLGLRRTLLASAALAFALVAVTEWVGAWAYTWPRSVLLCWPTAYLLVSEGRREWYPDA